MMENPAVDDQFISHNYLFHMAYTTHTILKNTACSLFLYQILGFYKYTIPKKTPHTDLQVIWKRLTEKIQLFYMDRESDA